MKLIKPSFEVIEQESGLDGIYRIIERVGRVCYKSEDKIAEGTAKVFVDRMVTSGHGAMLEHGTVYLKCKTEVINRYIHPEDGEEECFNELEKYEYNSYSVTNGDGEYLYVTTNLRVLVENDWLDDLQYQCEPTEHHEKRITVKFICDRGVSHEYVRHRVYSFAQESTRYCNYIKSKFGGSVSFIIPPWLNEEEEGEEFKNDMQTIENIYFKWLNKGWTAQQARGFLCNFLKTELIMTGTVSQWEDFFKLRDASSAHPQARELAHPLHEEFIKRGYVNV